MPNRLNDPEDYFKLFMSSSSWIAVSRIQDGVCHEVNPAFESFTGYSREEIIGKRPSDLIVGDDPSEIARTRAEIQAKGELLEREIIFRHKDGGLRVGLISGRKLRLGHEDYIVWTGEDITERKQAEEAQRQSERKYRELVENANSIIMRWDREGRITFMNEFGLAFFGYTEEELLGRHVMGTIVPEIEDTGRDLRPLMDQILAAPQAFEHNVNENVRRDGSRVWIAWTNKVLTDETGAAVGVLSIGLDVTERKRMEEALREADRRKDEFLLMLSHELRNPLAPIRNAVEVMRLAGQNPALQQRQQEIIERQLKHFARLIDDLLDVARITRGEIRLHLEPVSLRAVVEQALETAMILKGPRKDDFTCDFPEPDIQVRGDLTRLVQVICNLLDNAVKYSRYGERIHLRVTLEPSPAPDRHPEAVILVQDEGMGVAPEVLPHIFELFVQADKSLARTIGGLGVGLTLARRIVDLHGGSIEARSAGPGSSFCVRLPALVAKDAPLARASSEGGKSGSGVGKAPRNRVLVVDDNADEASSLEELVNLWGYTAEVALTGPQALSEYATFDPDIVLLDIGLPMLSGYEVAQKIRQQSGKERPFLVAVTGYGSMEDRQQALASGFNAHLAKPVDLEQLRTLLGQYSGMAGVTEM